MPYLGTFLAIGDLGHFDKFFFAVDPKSEYASCAHLRMPPYDDAFNDVCDADRESINDERPRNEPNQEPG